MENQEINAFAENNANAIDDSNFLGLSKQKNALSENICLLSIIASLENTELEKMIRLNALHSMAAMYSPIKWELEREEINAVIAQYQEKKKSLQNPLVR
jgi:hypothetical protein